MRLNLYRSGGTLRYDADGNAIWYVVDEDAPGEKKYAALRYGTIVECARYIGERESAEPQKEAEMETMKIFLVRARGANPDLTDDDGQPLWWNNEAGWSEMGNALVFTAEEQANVNLPLGGEWVAFTEGN